MSKTSAKQRVKQLLSQGYSQSQAANECGVSRRTVIRWCQDDDSAEAMANNVNEELIEQADTEVAAVARAVLGVEQRINDLLAYRYGQRSLAIATEEVARGLLPLCQSIITYLRENPAEITPRMLSPIAKAVSDLSKVSSDCWARATGIDARVRDEIVTEINAKSKALGLLSSTKSEELKALVANYYPLEPCEIEEEEQSVLDSDDPEALAREYRKLIGEN